MTPKQNWKCQHRLARLIERRAVKNRIRSREFLTRWAERMTLARELLDHAANISAEREKLYFLSTKTD